MQVTETQLREAVEKDAGHIIKDEVLSDADDTVLHYMSELGDGRARDLYASFGLKLINDTTLEFDPLRLWMVELLASQVAEEYDSPNHLWWHGLDLGGDDDVDYKSSYLTIIIEVLIAYCQQNDIPYDASSHARNADGAVDVTDSTLPYTGWRDTYVRTKEA
jgi:hypothetical protein